MKIWHDEDEKDKKRQEDWLLYDIYASDYSFLMVKWIMRGLIIAAVLFGLLMLIPTPVKAHEFYSIACCSGDDCAPLPDGTVKVTPLGYEWDGELFPLSDPRIKVSPDGKYHGCEYKHVKHKPCLYVPPVGF